MVNHLDESQVRTLEQMGAVLDGTHTLDFTTSANAQARCEWIDKVLKRFIYGHLKRIDKGLVLQYLNRFSGFSRAHITRPVQRWLDGETLAKRKCPPHHRLCAPLYRYRSRSAG